MKFKKFSSIENHYREKYLDILREFEFDKVSWYAREKIHGCNFSFITDGETVQVASREQLTDNSFYNSGPVIARYEDKVRLLKNKGFPEATQLQIYGELFGPGIQKGVNYGTFKEFMAFDIRVDDDILPITPSTEEELKEYGFRCAPLIGVYRNLDTALEESNEFPSRVANIIYGTEFDPDNIAEGLVLSPIRALHTPNGSRVMIKNKSEKFTEKSKRKNRDSKSSEPNPFIDLAEPYINQNRLDAVLSKLGEIGPKDFGRVIQLMSADVIEDMIKDDDLPEDWRKKDDFKLAGKGVTNGVSKFLKENLLSKL